MEFTDLVKERYSCKKFSDVHMKKNNLEAILEAGRLAPTARNGQEHHVYVMHSDEALSLVDTLTPCRYGATVVLVVTYDDEKSFTYPGGKRKTGAEDATIVATHMMLAAANEGIASCWINNFDPEVVEKALKLPENEKVLMMLDLGFAAEGAGPLPNHSKRKTREELVTFL